MFEDERISIASYCFQIFFSCQHRTTGVLCQFFVIFRGSFGHFNVLIEFSMDLLHAHALMHINWLKIQICVLGCMLRSHAGYGSECQTPYHRHSAANIEIPGF